MVMVTLRVGFYETEAKEDTIVKSLQEDQDNDDGAELSPETNHEEDGEEEQ